MFPLLSTREESNTSPTPFPPPLPLSPHFRALSCVSTHRTSTAQTSSSTFHRDCLVELPTGVSLRSTPRRLIRACLHGWPTFFSSCVLSRACWPRCFASRHPRVRHSGKRKRQAQTTNEPANTFSDQRAALRHRKGRITNISLVTRSSRKDANARCVALALFCSFLRSAPHKKNTSPLSSLSSATTSCSLL